MAGKKVAFNKTVSIEGDIKSASFHITLPSNY